MIYYRSLTLTLGWLKKRERTDERRVGLNIVSLLSWLVKKVDQWMTAPMTHVTAIQNIALVIGRFPSSAS